MISSLRVYTQIQVGLLPLAAGEIFLTELLLAHGANINQRDMAGNTPLLYACHFYRQNGRGVQLCAQLLFHKADPHFRVKDGLMDGVEKMLIFL